MRKPAAFPWITAAFVLLAAAQGSRAIAQSEAPIAESAVEPPPSSASPGVLKAGERVTIRVRQVFPCDGLSPGERLLNGLPPLAVGDRVLAELVDSSTEPAVLIGGTVTGIAKPRRFAKPGRVSIELGQLVTRSDGESELVPWAFDLEDRRFDAQMKRRVMLALFAAEGIGLGASLGAQAGPSTPAYIGLGAGVGLITGIGYASLMPGREARLEPGDTFKITVGTLCYQPVPTTPPFSLYPAPDPSKRAKDGVK
jgi:hypothetical protein